jgi:hypothetical protein
MVRGVCVLLEPVAAVGLMGRANGFREGESVAVEVGGGAKVKLGPR